MFNSRAKRFNENLRNMFSTPQGLFVLKCLKEDYVDPSAISKDAFLTYYKTGQKELIQEMIAAINEDLLENINTNIGEL